MKRDISVFAADEIELTFPGERIQCKDVVFRAAFRIGRIQGNRGFS